MWVFLTQLLLLAQQKKTVMASVISVLAATCALAWGGKQYVDEKHEAGLSEIRNHERIMNTNLRSINRTMRDIRDSVSDIRDSVKAVDETNRDVQKRVFDIYKTVYRKQGG